MNRSWGADPPLGRRAGHTFSCHGGMRTPSTGLPPAALSRGPLPTGCPEAPESLDDGARFRLADELAPMVAVWQRLLSSHRPDRAGRCRTCTQGGTGLPGTPWPCALHGIAALAQRRHGGVREA